MENVIPANRLLTVDDSIIQLNIKDSSAAIIKHPIRPILVHFSGFGRPLFTQNLYFCLAHYEKYLMTEPLIKFTTTSKTPYNSKIVSRDYNIYLFRDFDNT